MGRAVPAFRECAGVMRILKKRFSKRDSKYLRGNGYESEHGGTTENSFASGMDCGAEGAVGQREEFDAAERRAGGRTAQAAVGESR